MTLRFYPTKELKIKNIKKSFYKNNGASTIINISKKITK